MNGTFQMDDYGNFRIAVGGKWSEWANYRSIVVLEFDGRCYFGVSAFYEGVFPVETILSIEAVETMSTPASGLKGSGKLPLL